MTGHRSLEFDHLNSPRHLASLFDAENISYPRTAKTGQPSFQKEWLESHEHWLPKAVVQARQLNDYANKFVRNYILGSTHLGRVHAEVHQLRDGKHGTRSYRFAYSSPPLQQIPGRDPELSPLIRGIFEPHTGEKWASEDFSQQEPRLAVHFGARAKVRGIQEALEYYQNDPNADFHSMVAKLTGLDRKKAKIINLGIMYTMGVAKLARGLGVSEEEAEEILAQYHQRMPWVRALTESCETVASSRGYIVLLDGARCRFDMWEPVRRRGLGDTTPRSREVALETWPGHSLRRAKVRVAMNRLVQGSAARQTKRAMLMCWREGIVPLIQMHDELGLSVGEPETVGRVRQIMLEAVPLLVPMKVDVQLGSNWGEASQEGETRRWEDVRAAA